MRGLLRIMYIKKIDSRIRGSESHVTALFADNSFTEKER